MREREREVEREKERERGRDKETEAEVVEILCNVPTVLHLLYIIFLQRSANYALFWCYWGQICIKFDAKLAPKILKNYAETDPSNGAN